MQEKQLKPEDNQQEEAPKIEEERFVLDFDNPDYKFTPGRHVWRQHGPYLVCNNCELRHAVFIGMDKLMVGEEEDGTPILKTRRELNQVG